MTEINVSEIDVADRLRIVEQNLGDENRHTDAFVVRLAIDLLKARVGTAEENLRMRMIHPEGYKLAE